MFQCLTPYHGGIVTFGGNQRGRIIGVGKIGIHPYPSIDDVLFVEGLNHNLLLVNYVTVDMVSPSTWMSVLFYVMMGPLYSLPR